MNFNDVLLVVITVVLPPVGVGLIYGVNKQFWINVVLTILGFLPGLIHGLYLVLKTIKRNQSL